MNNQIDKQEDGIYHLIVFKDNTGKICLKENDFNMDNNKLIGFKCISAQELLNNCSGLTPQDEEYKIKVDTQISNLTKGKYKRSVGKCKYCNKESKGEYCSFNCCALDEKENGGIK